MDRLRNSLIGLSLATVPLFAFAASTQQPVRRPPPVKALVANFYYNNLPSAKRWYVQEMGFPVIHDDKWVVIVEVGKGMQIALVDASRGALKAVKNKGAMLAIETDQLQQWYNYVKAVKDIQWYPYNGEDPQHFQHGIRDHGDYQEFRVLDPGGYILEFYRWKPGALTQKSETQASSAAVIPAKAGIQVSASQKPKHWVPAFAGTTISWERVPSSSLPIVE